MLVDIHWLKEKYDYFNKLLWNGGLPNNIQFKTSNTDKTWGYAEYRCHLRTNTIEPVSITLSNKYDSPEYVKINVLLHEMIHIADYAFHPEHFVRNNRMISKRSYDAHGYVFFLPQMRRINAIVKDMGYEVNPNVIKSEVEASKLSAENQRKLDKKKDEGVYVFISEEVGNDPEWGKYLYSICHPNNKTCNEWINYIKTDNWWHNNYIWTDMYETHNEDIVKKKSNRIGHTFYIGVGKYYKTLEEYINKYDLKFVGHLYGEHTDNNPVNLQKPVESKPQENKIPVFRFTTLQGNTIEFKNLTMQELRAKLKERFPKWNDEAIDRALNNKKYYPMKENTMAKKLTKEELIKKIKDMVNEELDKQREDSSNIVGCRRSKIKMLGPDEFIQSIE